MWVTWKVIVREIWFCEKILAVYTVSWVYQIYFNFVPMLESRNVDHVKSNCSWDMFLWKEFGRFHSFTVSRVFQNYFNFVPMLESQIVDHIKTNCSWDMFLKAKSCGLHIFITISSVFQIYSNFVPMLESRNMDHVESICSWDMFLWKDSGVLHSFTSFSKLFQLCTHARIKTCGTREKYLFVRHVFVKKFWRSSKFHEFFKNISTLYPC